MPTPWRRRRSAGPALKSYRCRWSIGGPLIALGLVPAGICWFLGGWEQGLGRGYGLLLLIAGFISLFYVTSVMSTRFEVRADGLTRIANGRQRHFAWDHLRAAQQFGQYLMLSRLPLTWFRLRGWRVTGIGGRIVFRIPNLVAGIYSLLEEIERRAGIHRRERIADDRGKRGRPPRRPPQDVAAGAVGLGNLQEAQDRVAARRRRRWSLRPGLRGEWTLPREVGIVLALDLAAGLTAVVWALVIGDPPQPRRP